MLPFSDSTMANIRKEIQFIWRVHASYHLEGKMRLFSLQEQNMWHSKEPGFVLWFSEKETEDALQKMALFYRRGEQPNTPLLLDPLLYHVSEASPIPTPVGTGMLWTTILPPAGQATIPQRTVERLQGLGCLISPLTKQQPDGTLIEHAGLKLLHFLKEPTRPSQEMKPYEHDGTLLPGMQALADIADCAENAFFHRHYLLSGINYQHHEPTAPETPSAIQHPDFKTLFPEKTLPDSRNISLHSKHLQYLQDAATCWNAYGRRQALYDRYGVDISNLERNLQSETAATESAEETKKELGLLWHAQKKAGLSGKMRLFTMPDQSIWRARNESLEIWFDETELDHAAERIQFYFNGGVLPNSPLLLDPIIYQPDDSGQMTPVGTAIIWCSAISTGQEEYSEKSTQRINELGLFTGNFLRAQSSISGLKMLGFLKEPYRFSPEEQHALLTLRQTKKQELSSLSPEERDARRAALDVFNTSKDYNSHEIAADAHTALSIPGIDALFSIANTNGDGFEPYYLISGLEYLCTNGAFAAQRMQQPFGNSPEEWDAIIAHYTINLQHVMDAKKCWESYDKLHLLWDRFGIDVPNLEKNLHYYNLCGRKLELLALTGDSREDGNEKFQFVVPGWIPRAAITIIGATGGTGKSSLAHRLAILTSSDWRADDPNPIWLGSEIHKKDCEGLSIYFSGEDSAPIVNARAELMDTEGRSKRLLVKYGADFGTTPDGKEKNIGHFLEELSVLPKVDMVVIDPARKYLIGDEDDSEVVSQFFEAIEKFAVEKNCGMVVVHHLQKQAHPHDTRDILDLLRGSQVFIDRARVVIGLMREGEKTIAGLAKNNIPPQMGLVEGERLFVRDPERLDLFWLPGDEGVRRFDITREELVEMKRQREKESKKS